MILSMQKEARAEIENLLEQIELLMEVRDKPQFYSSYHRLVLALIDQADGLCHYGLKYLGFHMLDNLSDLRDHAYYRGSELVQLLEQWPRMLNRYIQADFEFGDLVADLLGFLQDPHWVYPLEDSDIGWLEGVVLNPFDREALKNAIGKRTLKLNCLSDHPADQESDETLLFDSDAWSLSDEKAEHDPSHIQNAKNHDDLLENLFSSSANHADDSPHSETQGRLDSQEEAIVSHDGPIEENYGLQNDRPEIIGPMESFNQEQECPSAEELQSILSMCGGSDDLQNVPVIDESHEGCDQENIFEQLLLESIEAASFENADLNIEQDIHTQDHYDSSMDAASHEFRHTDSDGPQAETSELLDLIQHEIHELHGVVEGLMNTKPTDNTSQHCFECLQDSREELDRIGSACSMIGLLGMQSACQFAGDNVNMWLSQSDPDRMVQALDTLKKALSLWQDYMRSAKNEAGSYEMLLKQLCENDWVQPLSSEQYEQMATEFSSSVVRLEEDPAQQRERYAQACDVDITIPKDVNREVLDGMLQELPGQTEELSAAILELQSDDYLHQLEVAKRIAHTLKGAASTVGIKGMANFMHNLEDILESLFKESAKPASALHKMLVDSIDVLEQMAETLLGQGEVTGDLLSVYQALLDWANRIDEEGVPVYETTVQNATDIPDATVKDAIREREKENAVPHNETPAPVKAKTVSATRLSSEVLDDLLAFSGEQIISSAQIQEKVALSDRVVRALRNSNRQIQALADEFEHLVEIKNIAVKSNVLPGDAGFDPLEIDQFNELRTFGRRLLEACADTSTVVDSLQGYIRTLKSDCAQNLQLQKATQEKLIQSRMVPVASLIPRLKRGIRQAGNATGKTAQLEVLGEDTLVDSKIIGTLGDCLLHLVRNAVDHGIESNQRREQMGKPLTGTITLHFSRQDDQIVIRCIDDGAGLNMENVEHKARSCGLLDEGAEFTSELANQLILQHGFSTRDQVTQLSGRGVGLDTVYASILDLKGSLRIQSKVNEGMQIELMFPASLLSAQVLLVTVDGQTYAVSTRGLEEITPASNGSIRSRAEGYVFQSGSGENPLSPLAELMGMMEHADVSASSMILVLRDLNQKSRLVCVDAVQKSTEVVMKPLSRYLPRIQGIVGSTVLGNGQLVPVLDILGLLSNAEQSGKRIRQVRTITPSMQARRLLIVEDSISTRRSLQEFVRDLGYEVLTAIDGVDAVGVMQKQSPDIVITDLEMPRMNGFELTQHVRSNQQTRDLPVIMLTSRSTEKHRQEASKVGVSLYLTKPFSEDLLQNAIEALIEEAVV